MSKSHPRWRLKIPDCVFIAVAVLLVVCPKVDWKEVWKVIRQLQPDGAAGAVGLAGLSAT